VRDYDPATYGDRMAEVYDDWFGIPAGAESTSHVSVYERG